MIQIGETKLATSRPGDLEAALLDGTGCSTAEAREWLTGDHPQPTHVAAALLPFLGKDAPARAELGAMIAAAGPRSVADQVAALYDAIPETRA